jgi:hypothetical protein
MQQIITEYPQFFTATNLNWQKLLQPDKYKDIVIGSLRFLVNNKRVKVFAFRPCRCSAKSSTPSLCVVCW